MSDVYNVLTDAERAALADPATVTGYLKIQTQLRDLTAELVTALDAMQDDPRAGIDLAKLTPQRIHELPDRDARHLLLAAVEQLAAFVIRDRATSADEPIPYSLTDEAERYAAQVEADEPPC